jgi:hypothetical protein
MTRWRPTSIATHEVRIRTGVLGRFDGGIWEPAAGRGAIVRELVAAGHRVAASDLIAYDDADDGIETPVDFLKTTEPPAGVTPIVTNAPFRHADNFVRHGVIELNLPMIVLQRHQALEGVGRSDIVDGRLHHYWPGMQRLPTMHRKDWAGKRTKSGGLPFCRCLFEPGVRQGLPTFTRISWREPDPPSTKLRPAGPRLPTRSGRSRTGIQPAEQRTADSQTLTPWQRTAQRAGVVVGVTIRFNAKNGEWTRDRVEFSPEGVELTLIMPTARHGAIKFIDQRNADNRPTPTTRLRRPIPLPTDTRRAPLSSASAQTAPSPENWGPCSSPRGTGDGPPRPWPRTTRCGASCNFPSLRSARGQKKNDRYDNLSPVLTVVDWVPVATSPSSLAKTRRRPGCRRRNRSSWSSILLRRPPTFLRLQRPGKWTGSR